MKEEPVLFRSGELALEGFLQVPDGAGPFPACVVCHPHPSYGGNMYNGVVLSLQRNLVWKDIAVLRFNFRGVGQSDGSYGGGIEEEYDVRAALDRLAAQPGVDADRLALVGYSFGASVAFAYAPRDPRVKALAAVSLPLSSERLERQKVFEGPKLFIWGSSDQFVATPHIAETLRKLPEPVRNEVIPGADHFWQGQEDQVAWRVAKWLAETLGME